MEVVKPDLGKTLTAVIDLTPVEGKLPLLVKEETSRDLKNPTHKAAALLKANQLIGSISEDLATANWFNDSWTKEVLDQIERTFDASCERWRNTFLAL